MDEFDVNQWEDDLLDDTSEQENDFEESYEEEPQDYEELDYEEDEDLLESYLRSKGINPNSIKIETENGIEEFGFNDLSREELMQILHDHDTSYDLTDDEINMLNQMRSNNWSSLDYNNYIAQQAISYYNQNNLQDAIYDIDDYSDEELFVMDLQSRIPDITEDEAIEELRNAKLNLELFEKKVGSLREDYRAREDQERQQYEQEARLAQEQLMNEFKDIILNTIEENRDIDLGGIPMEMSDDDMNTVASFILDSDAAGVRHIAKALNDPNAIFQMAWWLTRGQDAFKEINDYYKQQITQVARNNYNRGLEDGMNGNVNSAKAVVRKPYKSNRSPKTAGDLYDNLV